jgi:hypothetical protein
MVCVLQAALSAGRATKQLDASARGLVRHAARWAVLQFVRRENNSAWMLRRQQQQQRANVQRIRMVTGAAAVFAAVSDLSREVVVEQLFAAAVAAAAS